MYLNILKKDLKRKKTMNIILLMFIILAVMFVSSGLNNVLTVMNGTDYYLDKAEIGDYAIITMGDNSVGNIAPALDSAECVKGYKIEGCIFGSQDSVTRTDGTAVKTKNTALFQAIEDMKLNIFDVNNRKITEVKEGEVIICGKFIRNNGFEVGDYIRVKLGDTEMNLKIAGKGKDAFLGSDFMVNTRFLLNKNDYDKFLADEMINSHYQGEIAYVETDDTSAMNSVIADIPGIAFANSRSTLETCYVMEMIVAFIVLILSVCLIIVSFVVLRFSIGFTIAEEYREIGVMKAIGLKSCKIRGIYIVKYMMMAIVGGFIGFALSIPFGNMLIMSVSENMVLGNNAGFLVNFISTIATMLIIIMFAYGCTGRVKKLTPIDAIRSGQTGERFKKKSFFRIGKTSAKPSLYMSVNDIISNPKRFMTVIISFFICTLFVLMLVNTTSTMKSSNLISLFGKKSDIYVTDVDGAMKLMNTSDKNGIADGFKKMSEELTAEGMPCEIGVEIQYRYKLTSKGKDYTVACAQSVNIDADEYEYYEGSAPQNKNEIAVTPQISEKINAKIGDTVTVDFGTEKIDCIITGYFQTMQQLGDLVRFSDLAPTDMSFVASILQYQINFTDNSTEQEIEERKERIKELYDNDDVFTAAEYCADCVSVVPTLEAVQFLLLGITIVVVILVTILVERSFISDERSQIAILKAIGFKTKDIVKWHTARFGIAALIAAILAAVFSIPMTELCVTPIFAMMGAIDVDYNFDPLKIFLFYPLVIFAVTVITAWITSLYTKTIKTSEATNIE